jgi:hypothetical protein
MRGPSLACHFDKSMEVRLYDHERRYGKPLPSRFADWARKFSAKFIFDETPVEALEDFGSELMKEGLFTLPSDLCYFEWKSEEEKGVVSIFAQGPVDELKFTPAQLGDCGGCLSCWVAVNFEDGTWYVGPSVNVKIESLRKTMVDNDSAIDRVEFGHPDEAGEINKAFRSLFSCGATLSQGDRARERHPQRKSEPKAHCSGACTVFSLHGHTALEASHGERHSSWWYACVTNTAF